MVFLRVFQYILYPLKASKNESIKMVGLNLMNTFKMLYILVTKE